MPRITAIRRTFRATSLLAIAAIVAIAGGCVHRPGPSSSPTAFRAAVAGADWELRELDGAAAPLGAGGKRATLRFDADSPRFSGFSGCNSYFGTYTLDGASLRFGDIGMTKMACDEGMPLEQQLGAALQATRRFELTGDSLTLSGDARPVAKFVRGAP